MPYWTMAQNGLCSHRLQHATWASEGGPEDLALRTIRHDIKILHGSMVSFRISPAEKPQHSFLITGAFTAEQLGLALHSYPMDKLQKKYKHLVGLPIQSFEQVQPLLLIGADHPHLITPIKPVRLGPLEDLQLSRMDIAGSH